MFDSALAKFAASYADQADRDHATLVNRTSDLPVVPYFEFALAEGDVTLEIEEIYSRA
jgi:hypothetical protein